MKKQIIYLLSTVLLCVMSSCESYLDKSPDLGLDEDDVFNDFNSTRGYMDQCVNMIFEWASWEEQNLSRAHISQMSDETSNSYGSTTITTVINKGEWLSNNSAAEVGWTTSSVGAQAGRVIPEAFAALRICNRVIEKVPELSYLSDYERDFLLGHCYFYRGWFYFELIRRLGGMMLLDKYYTSDDDVNTPRLSYGESSDWIIEQLDTAISLLPDEWTAYDKGRPNKVAAYALKSMVQLYSASPLMRNEIGTTIQYDDYDDERVKLAAEYARDCINYIENDVPQYKMMDGDYYQNIFYHTDYVSAESLWYVNGAGNGRQTDIVIHWQNVALSGKSGNYGQACTSATQNMVNLFETINGYPAELTSTGWKCDDPDFDSDFPLANRDPRLDYFILKPGDEYGTISGSPCYISTWEGGRDLLQDASYPVRTRYMIKKWMWPSCVTGTGSDGYADYYYNTVHIRTTQVYLDYAEAMNEAYGPNEKPDGYPYTAVQAINLVRSRVEMCNVRDTYTADAATFRERIRNERAVELMFENHRWFDIRRWMIAEKLFSDTNPIKYPTVTVRNETAQYETPPTDGIFDYALTSSLDELRVFSKRNYWYPIASDESYRYDQVLQNYGW